MIFETIAKTGHEEVVFCHNKDAGLKAIIAIHNTVLGPALGGLRMWPYKTEQEAVNDVLRLSRGMTFKNATCLPSGGLPKSDRTITSSRRNGFAIGTKDHRPDKGRVPYQGCSCFAF